MGAPLSYVLSAFCRSGVQAGNRRRRLLASRSAHSGEGIVLNNHLPQQREGLRPPSMPYFFMEALTMAKISSGVSMGVEISFLGHTAAHRPQEVHRE